MTSSRTSTCTPAAFRRTCSQSVESEGGSAPSDARSVDTTSRTSVQSSPVRCQTQASVSKRKVSVRIARC